MMQALVGSDRASAVRAGVRIEMFTVAWMGVEAALAIGAGVLARSVLLTAFGLDSVIELISGVVLLWRLSIEAHEGETERVERIEIRATDLSAVLLVLLCLYVAVSSVVGLVLGVRPAGSVLGLAVSAAAIVIMPLLAWAKRKVNTRIESCGARQLTSPRRSPAHTWLGLPSLVSCSTSCSTSGGLSTWQ